MVLWFLKVLHYCLTLKVVSSNIYSLTSGKKYLLSILLGNPRFPRTFVCIYLLHTFTSFFVGRNSEESIPLLILQVRLCSDSLPFYFSYDGAECSSLCASSKSYRIRPAFLLMLTSCLQRFSLSALQSAYRELAMRKNVYVCGRIRLVEC